MTKCKRCKIGDLSSKGYCHVCSSYDQSAPSNLDFGQLCNTCNQYFTDYDDYLKHLQSHPICDVCKERFVSEAELHKHLKTHECPICHLYFKSITRHNKQHSQCDLCQKWFLDKTALNEHVKEHPQCEYCKDQFKSDTDLQLHEETEHKCPACNLYHHPILEHLKQHSYCNLCKKWFLDEKALNEHLTEHPQCEYCKNKFSTQVALISHIDSAHKCNVCYEHFSDVQSHIRNKHIYCRKCKKYFLNIDQYNRKHPKCQYCNERFENSALLENHILRYHYCKICKNYFYSSKELDIHLRSTHPDWVKFMDAVENHFSQYDFGGSKKRSNKNVKCSYCDKLFTTESGRDHHIREMHPNHKNTSKYQGIAEKSEIDKEINQIFTMKVRELYEERNSLPSKINNIIKKAVQAGIDVNIIVKLREIQQQLVTDVSNTVLIKKMRETQQDIKSMKCPYCDRLFSTEFSCKQHIKDNHSIA